MRLNNNHKAFFALVKAGLWGAMDDVLDEVQNEVICSGAVRSWMNGETQTFLLSADEDVVYVFAYILSISIRKEWGLDKSVTGAGCFGSITEQLMRGA